MNLIAPLIGKTDSWLGTTGSLGRVAVDTLEKVSGAALDSCEYYNTLGIKQLRALNSVHSFEAMRGFAVGSIVAGVDLVKRTVEDAQKGLMFATEMRTAFEDVLSPITPPEPVPATRTKAITKSTPI